MNKNIEYSFFKKKNESEMNMYFKKERKGKKSLEDKSNILI